MTARAFLTFIAEIRGFDRDEAKRRVAAAVEKTQLASVLEQRIETLSKGFKRRVAIAQAILHDPQVLIMDEPTDGLDPNQKHQVRKLIADMAADKAIIVSTHILEEVEAVCSRAVIINRGRIVADGTAEDLMRRLPYHNTIALRRSGGPGRGRHQGAVRVRRHRQGRDRRHRQRQGAAARAAQRQRAHPLRAGLAHPHAADRGRGGARRARQPRRRVPADHHLGRGDQPCMSSCATPGSSPSGSSSPTSRTPLATVFLIIFIALTGAFAFYVGGFFERGQADLAPFFQYHPWLYLLLVPAVAMRLWAEERKSGTIELLMTLPISPWEAILGKFFAAWGFIGVALLLTLPMWITVNVLGSPDNGVILAGYVGSFLMAGAFLAIGSCISALTKNQVIAFIVSASICFLLVMSGLELVLNVLRAWTPGFVVIGRVVDELPLPLRSHLQGRARSLGRRLLRVADRLRPVRQPHLRRAEESRLREEPSCSSILDRVRELLPAGHRLAGRAVRAAAAPHAGLEPASGWPSSCC